MLCFSSPWLRTYNKKLWEIIVFLWSKEQFPLNLGFLSCYHASFVGDLWPFLHHSVGIRAQGTSANHAGIQATAVVVSNKLPFYVWPRGFELSTSIHETMDPTVCLRYLVYAKYSKSRRKWLLQQIKASSSWVNYWTDLAVVKICQNIFYFLAVESQNFIIEWILRDAFAQTTYFTDKPVTGEMTSVTVLWLETGLELSLLIWSPLWALLIVSSGMHGNQSYFVLISDGMVWMVAVFNFFNFILSF